MKNINGRQYEDFLAPAENPINSVHDMKTTQETIKKLLANGTPDWVRFPHEYKAFVKESFAQEKEVSDTMAKAYQIEDQDILSNPEGRKVNAISTRDFVQKLRDNQVKCFTVDNGYPPQTVALWAFRPGTEHAVAICYLQVPAMYEWSVLKLDRHNVALYWLARMLEAGEVVRFLSRRIVIAASEDIGNADPRALPLAVAAMQACEFVGLPECQLPLAQAVTYLACTPKSNAATVAIGEARADIREGRLLPVPVHLRDQHYPGAARLDRGEGYQYAHDAPDAIAAQDYLGVEREYYRPVPRGFEVELAERLKTIRARLRGNEARGE